MPSDLILTHAVETLDKKRMLPAGTIVSQEFLNDLVVSQGSAARTIPLLRHGTVKEDILTFIASPPYDRIFHDQKDVADLLAAKDKIRLIPPLLEALDFFRTTDFYSYRHFLMVFGLSTVLAKDLLPDYQELIQLSATGPVHDIGKVSVPLQILKKTTPLSRNEKSILDNHAAAGYVLLSYHLGDAASLAARVARDHHERRDGSGYPRGIPLDDRLIEIIAVCDIYDALISPRPYRPFSYDNRTALEEITGMAERGAVGWDVVRAIVARNRQAKPLYREAAVSAERRGTVPEGNLHGVIEDDEGD